MAAARERAVMAADLSSGKGIDRSFQRAGSRRVAHRTLLCAGSIFDEVQPAIFQQVLAFLLAFENSDEPGFQDEVIVAAGRAEIGFLDRKRFLKLGGLCKERRRNDSRVESESGDPEEFR